MRKELKRISPVKFGVYMMLLNIIISIIIIPSQMILDSSKPSVTTLSGPVSIRSDYIPAPSFAFYIAIALAAILLFGFVGGFLSAVVYNFLAKRIGGIKIDLIDCDVPKNQNGEKNHKT